MKEVMFRGKRIDNGEWIEGFIVMCEPHAFILVPSPDSDGVRIDSFPVRLETVGQYTGLTDKNGKKIFEGDILFCTLEIGMGYREFHGKVVYKAPKFFVECGNTILTLDCDDGKPDFTIIGNIYDNP